MNIVLTDKNNPDFQVLCRMLDEELEQIVSGKFDRSKYVPYNTVERMLCVAMAYEGEQPVGCAGLREYDTDTVEVKRVFVKPAYRGRRIASKLMESLEKRAVEDRYGQLILETGELLAASVKLYGAMGFVRIANYGPYVDMQDSLCMRKELHTEDADRAGGE